MQRRSKDRNEPDRLPSDRDQALFEAGIKLGGIFHQYIGVPVAPRTAGTLERAIEAAVGLQPFIKKVSVKISPGRMSSKSRGRFAYKYLTAEMLSAELLVVVGGTSVSAKLSFRDDLEYPLMRVTKVSARR